MWPKVRADKPDVPLWELGKLIGQLWNGTPPAEKGVFTQEYEQEKIEYEKAMKQYNVAYAQYMAAKSRVKSAHQQHQEKGGGSGRKAAAEAVTGVFMQPIDEEDPFELAGKRLAAIRYGKCCAKRTQLFIGLAVSLATGLMPLAASMSFYALMFARMVNGLAITNLFPVVGAICTNWAPQKERGVFLAVLSGYIQLSVIISMPLTGFLADKFGWPSVFFAHSILGLTLSIWWALFYRDDPMEHPLIGPDELAYIQFGKAPADHHGTLRRAKPPYRQIFSTASIWAIFCAVFGNFLIVQVREFFNTFLPMFLISSLHFSNSETGLLSALPLILQFFVKWLTGFITDHLPSVAQIHKVRFCNSAAFFGSAMFFLLASLFSPEYFPRWAVVLCLTLAICLLGMNSGGFLKSVVLVSAQFSPTVMAAVQFTLCATIFAFSFVVPAMTRNGGHFEEYRRVFWMYVCALTVTNSVFVLFGSAVPAKWTQQPHNQPVQVWASSSDGINRSKRFDQ
uniref:HMG box domain-containing protein n=1 Tax=Globodera pallida TaxID=36090 RepID=A0A183C6I2_GLOPA